MKKMHRVGLLIPVYNRLSHTKKCLSNIIPLIDNIETEKIQYDIIIFDDGSNDGTSEWVRENYPRVHIMSGDGNYFWSRSISVSAQYAINNLKCDFVLLWNNDIICEDSYFREMSKSIETLDGNEVVGSYIYYVEDRRRIWSAGGSHNFLTGARSQLRKGALESRHDYGLHEVDWLTGMGTLIPVKVISRLRYWNYKDFPQYHGDSDFTIRAKINGFRLIVDNALKIYNDISSTGLSHNNSFRLLLESLYSLKSSHNIFQEIKFTRRFATSDVKYFIVSRKYFTYILSFLKWKMLSWVGINRNT